MDIETGISESDMNNGGIKANIRRLGSYQIYR